MFEAAVKKVSTYETNGCWFVAKEGYELLVVDYWEIAEKSTNFGRFGAGAIDKTLTEAQTFVRSQGIEGTLLLGIPVLVYEVPKI